MSTIVHLGRVDVLYDPAPRPASLNPGNPIRSRDVSLDTAQHALRHPLLQPGWLPSASMKPARVRQLVIDPQTAVTMLTYRENSSSWVVIREQPVVGLDKRGSPFPVEQGTIAGRVAAFFTNAIPAQGKNSGQLLLLTALFESGDLLVEITGPGLSTGDAAKIGESLR